MKPGAQLRRAFSGVVAGIAGYGNCMGIPTVGGETNFHAAYNGNILVNAMTVGVAPVDKGAGIEVVAKAKRAPAKPRK